MQVSVAMRYYLSLTWVHVRLLYTELMKNNLMCGHIYPGKVFEYGATQELEI